MNSLQSEEVRENKCRDNFMYINHTWLTLKQKQLHNNSQWCWVSYQIVARRRLSIRWNLQWYNNDVNVIILNNYQQQAGSHGTIFVKFYLKVNRWPTYHGVETLPKISIASVGRTNVTDDRRQTDTQTDETDRRTDDDIANVNVSSRSLKTTLCSKLTLLLAALWMHGFP